VTDKAHERGRAFERRRDRASWCSDVVTSSVRCCVKKVYEGLGRTWSAMGGKRVRDVSRTLKRSDGRCIKIVNLGEHAVRGGCVN